VRLLVTLTVLLGAGLLFVVEPMAAKMVLPRLGGSPAVWVAAMLFFQAVLLLGYGYAHWLTRVRRTRVQVLIHLALLLGALLCLPVAIPTGWSAPAGTPPVLWVLALLARMVGLPFLALACMGPLLQRWYVTSRGGEARDPYVLYAAGNAGSLAGLLAYPLVIEPRLPLLSGAMSQSRLWALAFIVAALGSIAVGLRAAPTAQPDELARVSWREAGRWVGLAFVPSSLLLGATQFLTTDIAAVPFLWVLPLALYLLTFVIAFSGKRRVPDRAAGWLLALVTIPVVVIGWAGSRSPIGWVILFHLGVVLAAGLLCHGRLAASRPPASRLTSFYWWIGVGGVLGGVFNALVAPLLFSDVREYPLVLLVACLLRPGVAARGRGLWWILDLGAPAALAVAALSVPLVENMGMAAFPPAWLVWSVSAALLLMAARPLSFVAGIAVLLALSRIPLPVNTTTLVQERTFFGVHRVARVQPEPMIVGNEGRTWPQPVKPYHVLMHGMTWHGAQYPDDELRGIPTSYYHRSGPLGQLFAMFGDGSRLSDVGVVGLGAGTVAAYGRPYRRLTFFEIDPAVVRIAQDPRWFTFLADSASPVAIVLGDGRLSLEARPDRSLDLLILDAFSSDAIPVHLVTREALELYSRKLRPEGLLAVHVSNKYLDLPPVLFTLADDLGLAARYQHDESVGIEQMLERKATSDWVVLAADEASLGPLVTDPRWVALPLPAPRARFLWTDDRSDLLGILRGE
jgi:hypothetical protein